jgi:hypothetical protein
LKASQHFLVRPTVTRAVVQESSGTIRGRRRVVAARVELPSRALFWRVPELPACPGVHGGGTRRSCPPAPSRCLRSGGAGSSCHRLPEVGSSAMAEGKPSGRPVPTPADHASLCPPLPVACAGTAEGSSRPHGRRRSAGAAGAAEQRCRTATPSLLLRSAVFSTRPQLLLRLAAVKRVRVDSRGSRCRHSAAAAAVSGHSQPAPRTATTVARKI